MRADKRPALPPQGFPDSAICRWCLMPRVLMRGAKFCPECDSRADLATPDVA